MLMIVLNKECYCSECFVYPYRLAGFLVECVEVKEVRPPGLTVQMGV